MYEYLNIQDAKVGDVVECINIGSLGNSVTKGKLYIIIEGKDGSTKYVGDDGSEAWFNKEPSRWALVKTKSSSKVEVGDSIIAIKDLGNFVKQGLVTTLFSKGSYSSIIIPETESRGESYSRAHFKLLVTITIIPFNSKILKENIIVHCRTQEQATVFLNWADKNGRTWGSKTSYIGDSNWKEYKEDTCYTINESVYSNTEYEESEGRNVWSYEDALCMNIEI